MLYQHALSDLDSRGLSSKLVTVEIGHWQPNTNFSLHAASGPLTATHPLDLTAQTIITTSDQVFHARLKPSWNS